MIRVLVRKKPDRDHLLLYFRDPVTRREVSRSAGTSDRREAERAAALWEQELRTYRGSGSGWSYFRDRFEDEHLSTLSRKSQKSFATALNHFERLMSPVDLAAVTADVISQFKGRLLDDGHAATSVATHLGHLRAAINWAHGIGMVSAAPKIKLPKRPKHLHLRGRALTEAEFKVMLKVAGEYRRLLELLWLSGLRLGEAMQLDWQSPPIKVALDARPYPQILYYAEGQKNRQDDALPITPDLYAWLAKTKERTGRVAPVPLQSVARVSEAISAIGEAAQVSVSDKGKWASAHDLRRSFGTRWAQKVMPMILQKLMRHRSIETTLRYYVGLSAEDAGRAVWGVQPVPKNVPASINGSTGRDSRKRRR